MLETHSVHCEVIPYRFNTNVFVGNSDIVPELLIRLFASIDSRYDYYSVHEFITVRDSSEVLEQYYDIMHDIVDDMNSDIEYSVFTTMQMHDIVDMDDIGTIVEIGRIHYIGDGEYIAFMIVHKHNDDMNAV